MTRLLRPHLPYSLSRSQASCGFPGKDQRKSESYPRSQDTVHDIYSHHQTERQRSWWNKSMLSYRMLHNIRTQFLLHSFRRHFQIEWYQNQWRRWNQHLSSLFLSNIIDHLTTRNVCQTKLFTYLLTLFCIFLVVDLQNFTCLSYIGNLNRWTWGGVGCESVS